MPTGTPYPTSPAVSGRVQQCLVTTRPIPATPTMAGVPIARPPDCRQARIGASLWFVSSPFYSVPTETPGEGAASGRESRHSGRGGTARYGTVRGHYGWHRAQQTRTPSQCSEGAHPASHLPLETAPSRARPSVFAPPDPPAPSSRLPQLGPGARPGGGTACPRSWQARRQGGGCARAARLAPAGVSVPRAIYTPYKYLQREERRGPRPAGGTLRLCTCHRRGAAAAVSGAGDLLLGLPPGSPSHGRRPAPSLGHRQSSRRGICHKAWASRGSRVLDHKCINLLRAFSTAMD